MLTSLSVQATPIQFDVRDLFNADVVVNYHNDTFDSTQDPIDAGNNEGGNFCFLTESAAKQFDPPSPNGLPDNGFFSANEDHPDVQLAFNNDDNNPNVLRVNSSPEEPFSFTVPLAHYTTLHFFLTSGDNQNNNVTFTPTLHYTDGTKEIEDTFSVPDWAQELSSGNSTYSLAKQLGRVNPKNSGYDGVEYDSESGNTFAIFGYKVPTDDTKVLQSISLEVSISGSSVLNFFGATGETNHAPVASEVKITGAPVIGEVLRGSYTYHDAANDPEGTSIVQWYRASDPTCTTNKTSIADASSLSYTLIPEDINQYLCFGVTPVAQTGASHGNEVIATTSEVITLPQIPTILFEDNNSPRLPEKLSLFIQVDGQGTGQIQSDRGLICRTQDCTPDAHAITGKTCQTHCSQMIDALSPVNLIPIAEVGSVFSSWGGHPDCTKEEVIMNSSKLCIAYFRKIQTHLAVTVEGPGQIHVDVGQFNWTTPQQGRATYDYGTSVTLTAIPHDSAYFHHWGGAEECIDGQVEMKQNQTCIAYFQVNTPPTAKITVIPPIYVNQKITLIGNFTDQDTNDTHSFMWELGEGQTAQIQNPSHFYTHPGRYPITFTVTDQRGGTGRDQILLDVLALEKEKPSTKFPLNEEPSPITQIEEPIQASKEVPSSIDPTTSPTLLPEVPSVNLPIDPMIISLPPHPELPSVNLPEEPVMLPALFSDLQPTSCQLHIGLLWEVCNAGGQRITQEIQITSTGNLSQAVIDTILTNQGWVSNLTITAKGEVHGGVVTGHILNQGLMEDFEFRGASLIGGQLGGKIVNRSPIGGYFKDIHLEADAHLQGGTLTGEITGDSQAPALLERVTVKAGSHLKGVKLGEGVKLEEPVIIEPLVVCRFWGVHDQGRNDSQLLTLDYFSDNFDINPSGPLHEGFDIESLDISPQTGELYAASGDDSHAPGHLYQVDKSNGELTDLGALGVKGVDALAFHPEGTLWGYAQDQGLFKITHLPDVKTFTVVLPPVETVHVGDITWDITGNWLYGVQNSSQQGKKAGQGASLWAYHLNEGLFKTLCPELDMKEIEMMETLPDGSLVVGFQEGRLSKFARIDLTTCHTMAEKEVVTIYNDIEALTWEGCQ